MNPVVTTVLAAMFLSERLTWGRVTALSLGVVAVLAACAGRLISVGGVDAAVLLLAVALLAVAGGGVYQQRFCSDVDFRAMAALQNLVSLPGGRAAVRAAVVGDRSVEGGHGRSRGGAVQRDDSDDVVRACHRQLRRGRGGDAVRGDPRRCGLLSWLMLGQRPDIGIAVGLVVGAAACWINARMSRQQRQEAGEPTVSVIRADSPAR